MLAVNAVSAANAENTVATENVFSPYYYVGGNIDGVVEKPKYAKGGIAFGALSGYQFNRYFALEGQLDYIPIGADYPNIGVAILAKGSLGIGNTSLSVFAKTGLEYHINTQESHSNDFGFPLVFGIDFLLTPHLTLEAAYNIDVLWMKQISEAIDVLIGKNTRQDYGLKRASIGLIYHW